jgi:gamma-glutamyltranspeptidase/glutathione hydrolase
MKIPKCLCGLISFVTALCAPLGHPQDRSQTRSMVISRGGIAATESPLASRAGVHILEHGGNAVDAAIAANAMMGVVEPMMNGIGGDLFVIVYDAEANKLYGLNASGWVPKGLNIEFLQQQGLRDMPQRGINSVTGPGVVPIPEKMARPCRNCQSEPKSFGKRLVLSPRRDFFAPGRQNRPLSK